MTIEHEHARHNQKKWDQWANSLDGKGWRYQFLRRAQLGVVSLLEVKENVHFLDIGCGTGWAVGQAAQKFGQSGSFFGADLSEKMIEKAKENFAGRPNIHFLSANAESIPLESHFFDIIICTNSFHHYLHPDKALKEMCRLLKRGGTVYVLDPTADSWIVTVADKIIRLFEPAHVKIYSSQEFRDLFEGAGLSYGGSVSVAPHQTVHIGEKKN